MYYKKKINPDFQCNYHFLTKFLFNQPVSTWNPMNWYIVKKKAVCFCPPQPNVTSYTILVPTTPIKPCTHHSMWRRTDFIWWWWWWCLTAGNGAIFLVFALSIFLFLFFFSCTTVTILYTDEEERKLLL